MGEPGDWPIVIAADAKTARGLGARSGVGRLLDGMIDTKLPLAILAAISLAEVVTAAVNLALGLGLHAAIILALLWSGARSLQEDQRGLLFALVVVPLIRICSLCLPLNAIPRIYWYPAIMAPVLLAAVVAARNQGYSARDLGLTARWIDLAVHSLLLVPLGLGLGVVEYLILKPQPITRDTGPAGLLIAGLIIMVATGFGEELVFRGLIQHAAMWRFRAPGAVLFVTALFTSMHIGYLSLPDLGFVAGVGALLGWIRWRSGTVLGVSLAHACVNLSLFLLTPLWLAPLLTSAGS